MRGATSGGGCTGAVLPISTHAPLAGRDQHHTLVGCSARNFNPRAPCGARRICLAVYAAKIRISTHAPLAGRDLRRRDRSAAGTGISTHAPLAGRDKMGYKYTRVGEDFNPRAPCGARLSIASITSSGSLISTHAPLAGRDTWVLSLLLSMRYFNPRAPCGARPRSPRWLCASGGYFNPRAPCGARHGMSDYQCVLTLFQPTRPLRGATPLGRDARVQFDISTHAPLAGRDRARRSARRTMTIFQPTRPLRGATRSFLYPFTVEGISTHAPLAGRDSKSVQITMHIFAITDKFQMLLHRMPPVRAFCSFLMQENHADFGCEPPK